MIEKSITKDFFLIFIAIIFAAITSFFSIPIIFNNVGAEAYGYLNFIFLLYFSVTSMDGSRQVVIHMLKNKNEETLGILHSFNILIGIILLTILVLIGIIFDLNLSKFFFLMFSICIFVPTSALWGYLEYNDKVNFSNSSRNYLLSILYLVMIAISYFTSESMFYISSIFLFSILLYLLFIYKSLRLGASIVNTDFLNHRIIIKEYINKAIPSYGFYVVVFFIASFDKLFIYNYLSLNDYGEYSSLRDLVVKSYVIFSIFRTVLYPVFIKSGLHNNNFKLLIYTVFSFAILIATVSIILQGAYLPLLYDNPNYIVFTNSLLTIPLVSLGFITIIGLNVDGNFNEQRNHYFFYLVLSVLIVFLYNRDFSVEFFSYIFLFSRFVDLHLLYTYSKKIGISFYWFLKIVLQILLFFLVNHFLDPIFLYPFIFIYGYVLLSTIKQIKI